MRTRDSLIYLTPCSYPSLALYACVGYHVVTRVELGSVTL